MARPRSEDKRNAILAAALAVIADQGTGAPTARIAKLANVAEGTLFTYFATKDELLNALYLELKTDLGGSMMDGYPQSASLKDRCRHVWAKYVAWGVAQPQKRMVVARLGVCDRVTDACRATGMRAFADLNAMLMEAVAQGALRDQPPAFATAILASLAETTMDFIARAPDQAERTTASGFEAFWRAIANA